MYNMLFDLILLFLGILASAIFSGLETGIYSVSRVKVYFQEKKDNKVQKLAKILSKPQEMVTTTLVGNNISHYLCSFATTHMILSFAFPQPELMATILLTPILFIFADMVPKELFRRKADEWMSYFVPFLRCTFILFFPLVYFLLFIGKVLSFLLGQKPGQVQITRQKIRWYLLEKGGLSSHLIMWVENLFRLEEKKIFQVMKPARQVICFESDMKREEVLALIRRHGYSRYPLVRRKGRRVQVIGVVHVFSILFASEEQPFSLENLAKTPIFLEPELSVSEGLRRIQVGAAPMGIVKTQDGRFLGIVTIKDFMEEFVGVL